jgi:hypothetical protein
VAPFETHPHMDAALRMKIARYGPPGGRCSCQAERGPCLLAGAPWRVAVLRTPSSG